MDLREAVSDELAHPRASVRAAIAELALEPGMQVLDVGCGAGAHLSLFADVLGPDGTVTGLDRDRTRLTLAREFHAARVATGRIRLVEADLHAIPTTLAPADCTWASLVLHHEAEPVKVLRGFARMTRPGGRVAILDGDAGGSFPVLPWPPDLELRLREAAWRAEEARYGGILPYHFAGYLGRDLPRLLREAGLTDVRLSAFVDVVQAPLRPIQARGIREWLIESFGGRIQSFLAPHDWERFTRFFAEESAADLLVHPDFFFARTWYLAVGTVRSL